jgi:hypothetical protein
VVVVGLTGGRRRFRWSRRAGRSFARSSITAVTLPGRRSTLLSVRVIRYSTRRLSYSRRRRLAARVERPDQVSEQPSFPAVAAVAGRQAIAEGLAPEAGVLAAEAAGEAVRPVLTVPVTLAPTDLVLPPGLGRLLTRATPGRAVAARSFRHRPRGAPAAELRVERRIQAPAGRQVPSEAVEAAEAAAEAEMVVESEIARLLPRVNLAVRAVMARKA